MATLTFTLSGSGVVNGSKAYTFPDADVQRLLNAWNILDAALLPPTPTPAQTLLQWVADLVSWTIFNVKQIETTVAQQQAQAGVTPIGIAG